jgi:hypothetical protein
MEKRMAIGGQRRAKEGKEGKERTGRVWREGRAEEDRVTDGPVSTAMVVAFFLDIVGMD